MAGSFDWSPGARVARTAVPVVVARRDDDGSLSPLANVRCERVDLREGADPAVARFRYETGALARAAGFPTEPGSLWSPSGADPGALLPDDRVVVIAYTPKGRPRFLFDGFVQDPQLDLDPIAAGHSFVAVGVASRCWDRPIRGRVQRDADDLVNGETIRVDLPARFNPVDRFGLAKPNRVPTDGFADLEQSALAHPVFVEEDLEIDPDDRGLWTLSDAVKYLLATEDPEGEWVERPDFREIDRILESRRPRNAAPAYDPDDPATYDARPIVLREFDADGRPWPDVVDELLSAHGFRMGWILEADEAGRPATRMTIERTDASTAKAPKTLPLDSTGSAFDPTRNSAERLGLARDVNSVVNAFHVATKPRRVEASVVLAPGFTPVSGDEAAAVRKKFLKSARDAATAEERRKYRWYVADECGEGHWDGSHWAVGAPLDLDSIMPPDERGDRTYVRRRRPGVHRLLSRDAIGLPRTATLAFCRDYSGPTAALWDGTGDWTTIAGGWQLLEDRLGIEVSIEDPEQWYAGKGLGDVRGVTWVAAPAAGKKLFLRLTTVFEDDRAISAFASKRPSSPTRFERARSTDARSDFRLEHVHDSSPFFDPSKPSSDPTISIVRDDGDLAMALAESLRSAHEGAPVAGSVSIPFLTNAYAIGDRISGLPGRGIDLDAVVGSAQGEARSHPRVVAIAWDFSGEGQTTTLQLSDRRAEPATG